jgi:hypothetical protein
MLAGARGSDDCAPGTGWRRNLGKAGGPNDRRPAKKLLSKQLSTGNSVDGVFLSYWIAGT